ncbi:Acetyl-CoA carboxylase, alpha subunit [Corchorus olitorius]|uniref:acetyl-CoA carboxytransferase n=1 Tax=Corchorus olitorius TaxID=93759 RepID=A0A1R3JRK7_9ROSI|nr:Acetyl-CoA carboxylase, alpha subunit [Corchorus olitorius]
MASISYSPNGFTGTSASDLLRSSSNGVSGIPLKTLVKTRFSMPRRNVTIAAKLRKGRKHEYPWPADPDPNVKGGVLTHLSPFKPLKEKPKPVTLDFEKPLLDLEKKIIDVRRMANETGLDFSDQIISLENKYQQACSKLRNVMILLYLEACVALKDLYTHLTPIQRVNIARHPNRPTFLDHVFNITDKFVELHGDRAGYDDPAVVTGIGTIDGRRYMFMGHQKGRNTKENIKRNFGMPTPHGYRKALRMMRYADHHGFPIVTFIDTPGAYADLRCEELGQGEAIAHNLRTMFGLKVPIISIVIGEGGSGGALAIGCGNKLLMLENAVFYVASPEACAAILWKSAKAAPMAAEKLRITATELSRLQICDGIIPEPLGGAHADPAWTSQQIKAAINKAMDELTGMDIEALLQHRHHKFRKLGGFQEGIRVGPKKTVNMKKREDKFVREREDKTVRRTSNAELEGGAKKLKQQNLKAKESSTKPPELALNNMIEKLRNAELEGGAKKLKQQNLKAKESSTKPPELTLDDMIEKLRKEVNHECSVAVKALGLKDRLDMLRQEQANSKDQLMDPVIVGKIEKLMQEFILRMEAAPNYTTLKNKIDMLEEFSKAKRFARAATLKQQVNEKFNELMARPDINEKFEAVKAEVESSGASSFADFDQGLKERYLNMVKDVELEFINALKSLGLDVEIVESNANDLDEQISLSDFKDLMDAVYDEFKEEIENVVNNSPELKDMMESLKLEMAKAGKTPDAESESKIVALQQQIRQSFSEAMASSGLKEKLEELKAEIFDEELENDLYDEINEEIENVVNSSELKDMIESLKLEMAKAGKTPDAESESKIVALQQQIKQRLSETIGSSELEEKLEELKAEIFEGIQSSDGSLQEETKHEEPSFS